ncbi:MAG TPA: zinc ribbon domain-containing protein [Solirubrobacteraceae bacterium]
MDTTTYEPTTPIAAAPLAEAPAHEACEHCGAPVDTAQRYCVVCGSRRRHAPDPAARFLSASTGRSRSAARGASGAPPPRRSSPGVGTALLLALIPLAIGLGVLVGRGSNNGDGKLLAALRAQKPEIVNVGGGGGGTATKTASSGTSVATLTSSFPLPSGYSVQLSTLPPGTTQSAASAAEKAARDKGATGVGLVSQSDYTILPRPPAGAYVIYAGAYKTRAAAEGVLAGLRKKFRGARVIALKSSSSGSSPAGAGKALATTRYGTANQVTGFKATPAALAQGAQTVNRIAKTIGKSYVGSQTGLPSQISVP